MTFMQIYAFCCDIFYLLGLRRPLTQYLIWVKLAVRIMLNVVFKIHLQFLYLMTVIMTQSAEAVTLKLCYFTNFEI